MVGNLEAVRFLKVKGLERDLAENDRSHAGRLTDTVAAFDLLII
jgi:hypothetical protein